MDSTPPDSNQFNFMNDFCILSTHLSIAGFKDDLLVLVNPRYLKNLTTSIEYPSIVILIREILTCEKSTCATVLLTFAGRFHFREYAEF